MKKNNVLMIVDNSYPDDPRVKKEAETLQIKYNVFVIAVKKKSEKSKDTINGVHVYRMPYFGRMSFGKLRYIFGYLNITISGMIYFFFTYPLRRYKVIHVHNPPDTLFMVGLLGKLLGVKFVFDHHDLSPDLYRTRFSNRKGIFYKILLLMERSSCKLADVIISTNGSYRNLVIERHGVDPGKVHIVRNNPIIADYRIETFNQKMDDKIGIIFFGMINPQDGLDIMCDVARLLVHERNRTDFIFNILGEGDALEDVKKYARQLNVSEYFKFHGYVRDKEEIGHLMSTSHIGVEPAPDNPLNKYSTFIKIMEYMAFGLPIVAFDLPETRHSANGSALLVPPGDVSGFVDSIMTLLDDPRRRKEMGEHGRDTVLKKHTWSQSQRTLIKAYENLIPLGNQIEAD